MVRDEHESKFMRILKKTRNGLPVDPKCKWFSKGVKQMEEK